MIILIILFILFVVWDWPSVMDHVNYSYTPGTFNAHLQARPTATLLWFDSTLTLTLVKGSGLIHDAVK